MSDHLGDQPTPERRIQISVPDDVKHGTYANFLVTSHGPHEFTLDFCQILPNQDPSAVTAEVVARVRVAPTLVAKVIQTLNTNLSNYEDRWGSVKAIG